MEHFETRWQARDGIRLYAQGWEPEGEMRAVVCLVHGLGEHSSRYAHLANVLAGAGYGLLAFDLRGHGRSEGRRGHTPSFEAYLQDIDLLLDSAAKCYPAKPVFLYGHSLGGVLVLNYVLRRRPDLRGGITTGAGLKNALVEQTVKKNIAQVLGAVAPALSIPSGLDVNELSRDPQVVLAYQQDPLVHDKITLGWARAMLPTTAWALEHAGECTLPLLLMHGARDRIAYPSGSQEFAAKAPKSTLKLWEGFRHEIHNEPEQDQVFAYLVNWLGQGA